VNRRSFIQRVGAGAAVACSGGELCRMISGCAENAWAFSYTDTLSDVEARYYEKLEEDIVRCKLCPRECVVSDVERGFCGVRENRKGVYKTLVYSRVCALNIDPIEKKPFYHYKPGTDAFSIATAGCNVNCKFCQNWNISQVRPEQVQSLELPPGELVTECVNRKIPTIAYTYSEPVVFFEYMYDCAVEARKHGVGSVVVTGGYIKDEPLDDLLKVVNAVKIDLKAFSEDYYRDIVNGELEPVLNAIRRIHNSGKWLEIVYLVVPGMNDSAGEIEELTNWILTELGPDVPIHFTRFHPTYLMKNIPPTPVETLDRIYKDARSSGLNYAYVGNVPGHEGENTYCPQCGEIMIRRHGYRVDASGIKAGQCRNCGYSIPGLWI